MGITPIEMKLQNCDLEDIHRRYVLGEWKISKCCDSTALTVGELLGSTIGRGKHNIAKVQFSRTAWSTPWIIYPWDDIHILISMVEADSLGNEIWLNHHTIARAMYLVSVPYWRACFQQQPLVSTRCVGKCTESVPKQHSLVGQQVYRNALRRSADLDWPRPVCLVHGLLRLHNASSQAL